VVVLTHGTLKGFLRTLLQFSKWYTLDFLIDAVLFVFVCVVLVNGVP
jgi:hypothetical protein